MRVFFKPKSIERVQFIANNINTKQAIDNFMHVEIAFEKYS